MPAPDSATEEASPAELRAELAARTSALRERGIRPKLTIVFVGEDEASLAYVRNLARAGERVGVEVAVDGLPVQASPGQVRSALEKL